MPIEDMELPSFIVADESSMIDPLRLDYLLQAAAKGKKILLVGDPAQLPFVPDANGYDGLKFPYAIGNKVSPAFAHPLIQNQVELTDVVRYEGDLAKLAFQLRSQNHLYLQTSGDRSLEAQMSGDWLETLLEKFLSEEFERDPNYVRAIAFTNERVRQINQAVRQARYGNNPQRFERGELLIAKEPVKIDGGLEGLETSDEVIVRSENICLDDNGIKCRFLQVDMGDRPLNGEIKVVHEDAEAQLKVELNKLKTNAQKVQNPKAWSDYYRFKEQYANLEYGYALTIHKSQGSTFQYVGVDEANINNYCRRDPEMGRALKYTAITRASQQVLVTHERAPRRSLVSLPGEVPSTVSSLPQKPADIRELVQDGRSSGPGKGRKM
jgi:exodeoxyribonuclease-5